MTFFAKIFSADGFVPLRFSTERKAYVAFAFGFVSLIVIGFLSYLSVRGQDDDALWTKHSESMIKSMCALALCASDAENAQRGYIITGDESYLASYHEARRSLEIEIKTLQKLAADNDAQIVRVNELADLVTKRMTLLNESAELWRSQGFVAAQRKIAMGTGRQLRDRFRTLANEMEAAENVLLQQELTRAGHSSGVTKSIVIGGSLAALSIVIVSLFAVGKDFSRRKRHEDNLNRLASIIENSADGIYSNCMKGIITSWNIAAEKMFGYSAAEVVGQKLEIIIPSDRYHEEMEAMAGFRAGEQVRRLETVRVRKGGQRFEATVTISPIKDHDGKIVGVSKIIRDITDRKLSEEALHTSEERMRQGQKMEAVGQLAGGVAHDFNNLLTVIIGRAELMEDRADLSQDVLRNVKLIHETGTRAAVLTRQLLQFSRQQVLQLQIVDLNVLIPEMQEMLRQLITEDIDLVLKLSSKIGKIKADPGQIQQVVMNLVINARDAMPNGGNVTIETTSTNFDAEYCSKYGDSSPGPRVMLAVSDTGSGMSEDVRAHIFEPFFTTKEQGKGTGLGLSTVYGIVKQAGGNIFVYSELNHGTIFKVYLPAVTELIHAQVSNPAITSVLGGGETILVVEDEMGIRDLLNETLKKRGYTILLATNGEEAIRYGEKHQGTIDLLLTDVIMPKMNGKDVATKLRLSRPEMKVIYMSGYTKNTIANRGVLDEGLNFLEKPFTPTAAAKRVREVLDSLAFV